MSVGKVFFLVCVAIAVSGCGAPCPGGATTNSDGRCVSESDSDAGVMGDATVMMGADSTTIEADAGPMEDAGEDAGEEEDVPPVECTTDADCDDGDACDGTETCEYSMCTRNVAPDDGASCDYGGADGICLTGECAAAGCGNGFVEPGEDCDDQNGDETDGCKSDCTFTCTSDADCGNDNVCDGAEVCDLTSHTCGAGTPMVCNDSEPCTADSCNPSSGCEFDFIDNDGDGVSPHTCSNPALRGEDCEDNVRNAFPGQTSRFTDGYCPGGGSFCTTRSFDYSCNGWGYPVTLQTGTPRCVTDGIRMCEGAAWNGRIPLCGGRAELNECEFDHFGDCVVRTNLVKVACN